MAKATKLPSGNWRVQVRIKEDGQTISKSFTAGTKREAEFLASQYALTRKEAEDKKTVAEAIEEYINLKTPVLSPATIRGYRGMQKNLYNSIGGIDINEITSKDLQSFVGIIALDHSAKTVKNAYSLLTAALSMYLPDKKFHVTMPQKNVIQRNIPDDEKVKALISAADPELRKAILLASIGTLRRGEIASLKYGDIKRDISAVYVHSDIVRDEHGCWIYKDIPKNSSSIRTVVLPEHVIKSLGEGLPDENVISLNPAQITNRFMRLRDKLGMKCRFHDLRHYAASIMHALGVPDQYIMERGGWKTDTTLKAVYRNILDDKSKKFTDITNNYLDNLID